MVLTASSNMARVIGSRRGASRARTRNDAKILRASLSECCRQIDDQADASKSSNSSTLECNLASDA
eukprot:5155625-Pyramimonas_sp.AAC.1